MWISRFLRCYNSMWTFLNILGIVLTSVKNFLRSLIKGFLRRTTRLCELQRICYETLRGGLRTLRIEEELYRSRSEVIKEQIQFLDSILTSGAFNNQDKRKRLIAKATDRICDAKNIKLEVHERFVIGLADCLETIWSLKYLNILIKEKLNTNYDKENDDHEDMLLQIWQNLRGDEDLSGRISKQWQQVGFQGSDPMTDFRSSGILALESLLYFSSVHETLAVKLLKSSYGSHRVSDYPYALVAIHVTVFGERLFTSGDAKRHFYNQTGTIVNLEGSRTTTTTTSRNNSSNGLNQQNANTNTTTTTTTSNVSAGHKWEKELLSLYFDFFSSLMVEFNSYWDECKPETVMKFPLVWVGFEKKIRHKLKRNITLQMDIRTV